MRGLVLAIGVILGTTLAIILLLAPPAGARESRFMRSLQQLGPVDRLEQLCDYTAMQRIRKEHRQYRPDRAVAGASADTRIDGDTLVAKGGAFRSRKKWYALSYKCTAAPDHLSVISFSFSIGDEIPEEKWASYGLWQ